MSVQAAYKALMEGGAPSKEDVIMQGMCKEWIWEFLLKHCGNSRLLRALAVAFPLPDSSLHLKRLLLLKSLSFDLSEDNFTDRTLETTSALSSLYRSEHRTTHFQVPVTDSNGNTVLHQFSLWMLHLAVRVECTVQYLRAESDDWPKFYESLEKHWGNVAEDTEEPEHNDDEDDEDRDVYMQLKEELWAVLKQPELRHDLLKTRKREYVVRMMQSFLNDAWKDVGLVFLEGVGQNLKDGLYVPDGFSLDDQLGTREEAHEGEKLSPVRPVERSVSGRLQKPKGSALRSVPGGQTDVFERRKSVGDTSMPQDEVNVSTPTKYGTEGPSKLVDTSKELEKEPDFMGGRPSAGSLGNLKHTKTSLGCTTETEDEQINILLPRKRKMPSSLQKKKTDVTLPYVSRDVLQADRTVQSRLTRSSSLVDKGASLGDFVGVDGSSGHAHKFINTGPSEILREKDICVADANKTRPNVGEKRRDEGVHDLEEENQACVSPPPWAGSPCLNETVTARKRPILAPLCFDTSKRGAAVHAKSNPETPVILKAQIELKEGQASLNAVVQDPLPEAMKIAEEAAKTIGFSQQACEPANASNQGMQPLSENININTAQDRGGVMQGPHDKQSKKNIMDRNSTAHTIEWEASDDIADSSDDRSPSNSRHVRLPKLRTRQSFAHQGGIAARNEPRRRKFRRWNLEEENILRKEVERYGKGQWKHILQKQKAIFEGRTEVDLKDKWRNIEKREGIS